MDGNRHKIIAQQGNNFGKQTLRNTFFPARFTPDPPTIVFRHTFAFIEGLILKAWVFPAFLAQPAVNAHCGRWQNRRQRGREIKESTEGGRQRGKGEAEVGQATKTDLKDNFLPLKHEAT
jgi:hypothetical protein